MTDLDAYADLDAYICEDVPAYDPDHEPPTVVDLPDVERRLRYLRVLTDRLRDLERVAQDDIDRIRAWLEDRSGVVQREIDWHTTAVERWFRAHVSMGGTKTLNLPSGTLALRQGSQKIEPLTKAPSDNVPSDYVRVKSEWDRQAIAKATAPGPIAEGVEAPDGYVAHWAVDANGERVPDVVRLVPVEPSFSLKVSTGESF